MFVNRNIGKFTTDKEVKIYFGEFFLKFYIVALRQPYRANYAGLSRPTEYHLYCSEVVLPAGY